MIQYFFKRMASVFFRFQDKILLLTKISDYSLKNETSIELIATKFLKIVKDLPNLATVHKKLYFRSENNKQ